MQTTGAVHDLRPLATGPVATVYVGRLASTGADVAVKVFADSLDRDTAAWLARERKALHQVRHVRSILPIDGLVDHTDGRTGVWMELCQGSLAGLLSTPGAVLAAPDVIVLATALAEALTAAHSVGVVHGGVTPHNVLFRQTGEVTLSDFGLSLRERFPRDPMHAVEYMSPETLRDGTVSTSSDLYGLGAVLYTALTGASPFPRHPGEAHGDRILRVLREPVPPIRVPGAPDVLGDMIGLLLAKDPTARFRTAEDVAALLANLTAVPPAEPEEPAPDYDFDDFADLAPPITSALDLDTPTMRLPGPGSPAARASYATPSDHSPVPSGVPALQVTGTPASFLAPAPPAGSPTSACAPENPATNAHPPTTFPPPAETHPAVPESLAQPSESLPPAVGALPTPEAGAAINPSEPVSLAPHTSRPATEPQPTLGSPTTPAPTTTINPPQPLAPAPHNPEPTPESPTTPAHHLAPTTGPNPPEIPAPAPRNPSAPTAPASPAHSAVAKLPQPAAREFPSAAPWATPATPAGRTLVRMDGPTKPSRLPQTGILIALGTVIVALAGALVFTLTRETPAPQPAPMTEQPRADTTPVSPVPQARLELATPTDEGTHVQLSWSAEGDLDFAVIVAGEHLETAIVVADRKLAMRLPIDPGRRYCFQVRATDGEHIYTSDPQPIRGARCKP
ncbi:protein kinase domain-containing protein [Actinokineospora sp. HUAS TT18]|uniref:serine/threonine protein kinase n=1 Tax=Actinokineospora sp. HUAS TT18 TaxID=3447451 RepID=UPI003F524E05